MEDRTDPLKNFIVGIIVGITSMLPGISGATMLVVFGVYERIIRDLAKLRVYLKKDFKFILIIILGVAAGTIICAKILNSALELYPAEALMFFIGLIAGQVPILMKDMRKNLVAEKDNQFDAACAVAFAAGIAIMIAMIVFEAIGNTGTVTVSHNLEGFMFMVFIGIVVAVSALLPGLSHSTLLLVCGLMTVFTAAISDFDVFFITAMAIGAIAAVIVFSKVIDRALNEHRLVTMLFIIGLTVGSILVIGWNAAENIHNAMDIIAGCVCLIVGVLLSLWSVKYNEKHCEPEKE